MFRRSQSLPPVKKVTRVFRASGKIETWSSVWALFPAVDAFEKYGVALPLLPYFFHSLVSIMRLADK